MALIKLDSELVWQASTNTLERLIEHKQEMREPMVQKRMKGFLGLFKKTREQAIKSLENESGWSDYNMVGWNWLADTICPKLINLCLNSKDGFVYVNETEWLTIEHCYKED